MKLDFKQNKGLLPFEIGTNFDDIRKELGQNYKTKRSLFFTGRTRIFYEKEGLFFDINSKNVIEAIETNNKNSVFFNGVDLFSCGKNKIEDFFKEYDSEYECKDGYVSKVLGISVYFENGKDKPSSVISFTKEYYDCKPDIDPIQSNGEETSIDDLYNLLD